MGETNILEKLGEKAITADELAEEVKENLELLPQILAGITSTNPRIKLGCAKVLRTVSVAKPEALYPEMDFFVNLLDSDNTILKWNAMDIVANLAKVDKEDKFDKVSQKFFGFLRDGNLVTAAHVVDNSGTIAQVKPELRNKITEELLGVEEVSLPTKECTNILIGKAIVALDAYFDQVDGKDKVILFVKKHLNNTQNATKKKAEKFLAKNSQ